MGNTISNLGRDVGFVMTLITTKNLGDNLVKTKTTISEFFDQQVQKFGPKTFVELGESSLSYSEFDKQSNKYAEWGIQKGLKCGDCVGLVSFNRIEFLLFFMGMIKIGVKVALLNPNVVGRSLAHAIKEVKCRFIIFEMELLQSTSEVVQILAKEKNLDNEEVLPEIQAFCFDKGNDESPLTFGEYLDVSECRTDAIPGLKRNITTNDIACYIYTSGTTGLPKAAKISHLRFILGGFGVTTVAKVSSSDVVYCPLPLYHSSALIIGFSGSMGQGATIVFRRKFSATQFCKDCVFHKATIAIYIGELCRYLCLSKETEFESKLNLRLVLGNGLRRDVWEQFQKRFNVPLVIEFYASTEGNAGLINFTGRLGACGFLSPIVQAKYPIKLVRFDVESGELVRDDNGLCIPCKEGEIGQLLGYIDDNDPLRKFDGYSKSEATQKKIAENVLKKGDKWFMTGDLLKMDNEGYVYFIDRIGETFRFKGENVSTKEVEEVLMTVSPNPYSQCCVYGVEVPGLEGRCGMACFTLKEDSQNFNDSDLVTLFEYMNAQLPRYARPYFLRITKTGIDMTATFKQRKVDLVKESFDIDLIKQNHNDDRIWFADQKIGKFVEIDNQLLQKFKNKEIDV